MKIKMSEQLNRLVAKCEGVAVEYIDDEITQCFLMLRGGRFNPSTNWAQAGPIIENHISRLEDFGEYWEADCCGSTCTGPTPLIAAMRSYVASKLGDEIETPEGLIE